MVVFRSPAENMTRGTDEINFYLLPASLNIAAGETARVFELSTASTVREFVVRNVEHDAAYLAGSSGPIKNFPNSLKFSLETSREEVAPSRGAQVMFFNARFYMSWFVTDETNNSTSVDAFPWERHEGQCYVVNVSAGKSFRTLANSHQFASRSK